MAVTKVLCQASTEGSLCWPAALRKLGCAVGALCASASSIVAHRVACRQRDAQAQMRLPESCALLSRSLSGLPVLLHPKEVQHDRCHTVCLLTQLHVPKRLGYRMLLLLLPPRASLGDALSAFPARGSPEVLLHRC